MPADITLGDNYQIDENSNGNLVIIDSSGNPVLEHTDGGAWSINTSADINDLTDSTSGNTVYDSSTETFGDGNQNGNFNSVNTDESLNASGLLPGSASAPREGIGFSGDNISISKHDNETTVTADNTSQGISDESSLSTGLKGTFVKYLVFGSIQGSNIAFLDEVTVVEFTPRSTEKNDFGAGPRTYTYSAGELKLAIDDSSETYVIAVVAVGGSD